MARRISRKQLLKQDDFAEAASGIGHWLEENWRRVATWAGVALGVVVLIFAFIWYGRVQRAGAERELAAAQTRFEELNSEPGTASDDDLAGVLALFSEISGGSSGPAQQARYYEGAILYRMGRIEDAIEPLEDVLSHRSNPKTLLGISEALLAHAYAGSGQHERAIELLSGDGAAEALALPEEQALLLVGRIQLDRGEEDAAKLALQRVIDDFPQTTAAIDARGLLGS